jgi:hypothetical protein
MDRQAVQAHVAKARKLASLAATIDPDEPTFAGAYLDHEGGTKLTIRYVGSPRSLQARLNIREDLKSSVAFVPSDLPMAALRGQQQRFLRSAAEINMEVGTYIDTRNNRIVVTTNQLDRLRSERSKGRLQVPDNAQVRQMRIPDRVAGTQPSGSYPVQSGDFMEGGRKIYQWNLANNTLTATHECTTGFVAKWNNITGFLTAGHCQPGNYGTGYYYSLGHWVELWGPDYESVNATSKYDFQFHRSPGFTNYATILASTLKTTIFTM